MKIPDFLLRIGKASKENQHWLDKLLSTVQQLEIDWKLDIGEAYVDNVSCSYVAPCTVKGGKNAVLKVGLPHEESRDEITGLIHLNGKPTVKIYQYDKRMNAMLLEQCMPGTHLNKQEGLYQDKIVSQILKELWETDLTGTSFRTLSLMVEQWNAETMKHLNKFPSPELAIYGCQLKKQLITSTTRDVFLATDLHASNILKAERKEWLAIDIKPYIGDPVYDLTQHIMNSLDRLQARPKEVIVGLSKLADVDPERLKKWVMARLYSEHDGIHQELGLKLSDS